MGSFLLSLFLGWGREKVSKISFLSQLDSPLDLFLVLFLGIFDLLLRLRLQLLHHLRALLVVLLLQLLHLDLVGQVELLLGRGSKLKKKS